ncbi:MAG: thymidine phosphorylase [Defluviitaleaceae bacterium]|nr:thymidine phosphorylase [Defluviitaleaceae bacterium]
MRAYDIIMKKRNNTELTKEEIQFLVNGYTGANKLEITQESRLVSKQAVKDEQMAAFLMATMFNGLSKDEIYHLTMAMAHSGEVLDLSPLRGVLSNIENSDQKNLGEKNYENLAPPQTVVDKHSTGGVGDKLTLLVAPIVAAAGVPVAKMSGAGLGHTGGTLDKLSSIPGFKTELNFDEFINIVNKIGLSIIGQTKDIAPADKKIYALRDTTATVDNIGLIAASIMSKKLASGADAFVLDVKVGSGAFMKSEEEAKKLAITMIEIAEQNGKKAKAILTNMDEPLGFSIGNSLEIIEVLEVLERKKEVKDIEILSLELSANMLFLAGKGDLESCRAQALESLTSKKAYKKFLAMVEAQGGSLNGGKINFGEAKNKIELHSKEEGYIQSINAEKIGTAAMVLGAGRAAKEDKIDYTAGIILNKKVGDYVSKGETLLTFHTNRGDLEEAERLSWLGIKIGTESPISNQLILGSL